MSPLRHLTDTRLVEKNERHMSSMEGELANALDSFWNGRETQSEKQRLAGKLDAGLRGAVTGGGHLDGVRDLVAQLFIDNGIPESDVRTREGIRLPGYYRPTKKWDLVVVSNGILVAAIELKSQVGPSFGNNFNNRTEEAIGNAVDVWRAYEGGTFGSVRPWLGYVFVLEDAPGSTKPVAVSDDPIFRTEGIFKGTSYADRYQILCDRLVRERLYDAAWFVLSSRHGNTTEPSPALGFTNFVAAIAGRVAYVKALGRLAHGGPA